MKGSHKFITAVLGTIALAWAGYYGYTAMRLSGVTLDAIEPGQVNIVAIAPATGYKIIVANQIAYLGQVEGGFEAGDMDTSSDSVVGKSRLPLRELLQSLQGDEKAFSVLVMRLNDWQDTDTSRGTKIWTAEDIEKALAGDADTTPKLEADLNLTLDGVPLDTVNVKAIIEGIIIDSPVRMSVNVGGKSREMVARVQEIYIPQFNTKVYSRFKEKAPSGDMTDFIRAVYREEASPIIKAGTGENVRGALSARIAKSRMETLTDKPRQVLNNTVILLNDSHLTSASFTSYDVGQGQEACDISIGMTDPGRMRLWKYSHENRGFQLLFIVDSVAIAAPRITTDLAESNVTIRRVPSKDLVADAVDLMNEIISEKK